jgi:UDP-N-acetylglucosamine transferase subunit ALG13
VTSGGGHLTELLRISEDIAASRDSLWVTFDTPQSRSVLRGRRTLHVPYVPPRGLSQALKAAHLSRDVVRDEDFDLCLSSGAAVAMSVLPIAAAQGVPTVFIESLARTEGPSLTGRLLRAVPRVRTMTQYAEWSSRGWPFAGNLLDDWSSEAVEIGGRPTRILVTLGTIRPYRFDRAVDAVLRLLRPGHEVTWQLGSTTRADLPGEVHEWLRFDELCRLTDEADVVVTHAGVGTILQVLEAGKSPVLAVRERDHGEHVDDHQQEFARLLDSRSLGVVLDFDAPVADTLDVAFRRRVTSQLRPGLPNAP